MRNLTTDEMRQYDGGCSSHVRCPICGKNVRIMGLGFKRWVACKIRRNSEVQRDLMLWHQSMYKMGIKH